MPDGVCVWSMVEYHLPAFVIIDWHLETADVGAAVLEEPALPEPLLASVRRLLEAAPA